MKASIAIVDYGMGNLRSVQKAFQHVGVAPVVTDDPEAIVMAPAVVLPGVGAFGDAMANLHRAGLVEPIRRAIEDGRPLLGICLGQQLLFEESEEMGQHRGLGVFRGRVLRFPDGVTEVGELGAASPKGYPISGYRRAVLKVPHIGWNQIHLRRASPLLTGVRDGDFVYFVHSYYVVPSDPEEVLATTDYGVDFASVVGRGNVFGIQFHPEKSQDVGLCILRNFARICSLSARIGP